MEPDRVELRTEPPPMLKLAPLPRPALTWKGVWLAIRHLPSNTVKAFREFSYADLRWSYLVMAGLILVGIACSLLLKNGWTIWPLIPVIGAMVAVNEAADRNAQGIPPFEVYALFIGAIVIWTVGVVILSCVNVAVQIMGLVALVSYTVKGYREHRAQLQLMFERRAEGRCLRCGAADQEDNTYCENCGEEPDPERSQLRRLGDVVRHGARTGRARTVLKQESHAASAARKEAALLARAPHRMARKPRR